MTSRTASGAQLRPGSLRGKYAPLPSGSILPFPQHPAPVRPLERSKALQAFIDCLAVASAALVICITAASIPVALFLLLFASFD